MTDQLTLVFTDNDVHVGTVFYGVDGLSGNTACLSLVRNRMKRRDCDEKEAILSLHGWSNGSLHAHLKEP